MKYLTNNLKTYPCTELLGFLVLASGSSFGSGNSNYGTYTKGGRIYSEVIDVQYFVNPTYHGHNPLANLY